MGAWGPEIFENDAALDWLHSLADVSDLDPLIRVLQTTIRADYLDADVASETLGVASALLALRGKYVRESPPELLEWAKKHPIPVPNEIWSMAMRAVTRVLTDSELKDLWEESDSQAEWKEVVNELLSAIEAEER